MAVTFRPNQAKGRPSTCSNVGDVVAGVAGLSVTEYGGKDSQTRVTVFTLTNLAISSTDATTSGAYGSQKIYDFPAGQVNIKNVYAEFTPTASSTNVTTAVKFSVGTAAEASNDTLDSTQANILPSTAGTLATLNKGRNTAAAYLDGTSTAVDAYLNLGIVDANSAGNGGVTVTGKIMIEWSYLA